MAKAKTAEASSAPTKTFIVVRGSIRTGPGDEDVVVAGKPIKLTPEDAAGLLERGVIVDAKDAPSEAPDADKQIAALEADLKTANAKIAAQAKEIADLKAAAAKATAPAGDGKAS